MAAHLRTGVRFALGAEAGAWMRATPVLAASPSRPTTLTFSDKRHRLRARIQPHVVLRVGKAYSARPFVAAHPAPYVVSFAVRLSERLPR